MNKNQAAAILVVGIIIGSIALVAFWNPTPTPDVRIGYLSKDLHQLALRVAIVNGYFERDGLTVDLVQYGNGAYEMDGFLGNQIDMGYLGAAPAMTKRLNQDILITILATANLEGSAIMVLKSEYDEGRITTVSDLAGKTVLQPGSSTVQNFLLRLALNQSGLSYSNITAQTTSPLYMADSLSPEVPAFIAWEPFDAKAEYDGTAVPLILSGEIWPRHPCCVVAAKNEFLTSNPDIVQKVIAIHKEAQQWILDNPVQAVQIAMDWLEMDQTPVELAFNRIIYDYNVNRTGLERYLNFLIDENILLPDKIPTNTSTFLDSFINTTYIESV